MKNRGSRLSRSVALFGVFLFIATALLAGPPLVCHSFDIGSAKSLPWISHSWNLTGTETYDTSSLTADTMAILAADHSVIVHMETLRRATLYARKDPAAAKELLTKITAGTKSASSDETRALNYFDTGYLAEVYKQWLGDGAANPATGLDGRALIREAIQLRGSDPQMEFAAALVTLTGPSAEYKAHVDRAIAGAKNDPLLARNLNSRFGGNQGPTMAEMLTKTTVTERR
jgi:hypothetical protein